MTGLTQQRLGAQEAAASTVLHRKSEFLGTLSQFRGEAQTLLGSYRGAGAAAFTVLIGEWLDDAQQIVGELDLFAARLVEQDTTTARSQDDQMSTFRGARTALATRLG